MSRKKVSEEREEGQGKGEVNPSESCGRRAASIEPCGDMKREVGHLLAA